MAVLQELVRNILVFYIILSILMSLVSNSSFKPYIQMFSGLVMIIIVLTPVMKLFGTDSKLDLAIQKNNLLTITQEESDGLMAAELKQGDAMMAEYESTIEKQVAEIAKKHQYAVNEVEVSIEKNPDSNQFGEIKGIALNVSKVDSKECLQDVKKSTKIKPVTIPEIEVGIKKNMEEKVTQSLQTKDILEEISSQYQLNQEQIQIQLEGEEKDE